MTAGGNWHAISGPKSTRAGWKATAAPVSLPFEAGEHRRAAVKIVDDRGIESLKIVEIG